MTFDVKAQVHRRVEHGWKTWFEIFSICRGCRLPTVFLVSRREYAKPEPFIVQDALVNYTEGINRFFEVDRFIGLQDNVGEKPPEHLPKKIVDGFSEAAACLSIGCNNAAAAMFRLCIDLVTRPLLPDPTDASKSQPNSRTRRDLGLRLQWMFDNGILPSALRELARCIREDANDGAHVGNLTKRDAEDLLDFTRALLERLITEPKRLEIAEARRRARRSGKG